MVDSRPTHRRIGKGATLTLTPLTMEAARAKAISIGSQSLLDIPARLRDMDALGLDVQVLFASCFNRPMADHPRLETALHRAWNRLLLAPTIERLGPEIFMLSSDMPHAELREGAARQVAQRTDLAPEVKRKLFHENTIRFFGPAAAPATSAPRLTRALPAGSRRSRRHRSRASPQRYPPGPGIRRSYQDNEPARN